MAQPPGSETVASPDRASMGPSTSTDARILRTMSYGATVEAISLACNVIRRPGSPFFTPATWVETPS